ncbi:alpha-amylase family glycosyl hydrolase [Escherichia coli]|nr:alpha-amylase family glycosyl hydrolase [Escherichia coli]
MAAIWTDSEKLPYLKKLMTALYLNPVFKAPAYINTIPRIIAMSIRSLTVMGRCCAYATTRSSWNAAGADGVFNHSSDSHAWFDRHNRGTGGELVTTLNRSGATGTSFSDDGTALDWLGYASLPKLDYQSESLVNEIYRGEDSIVRHWLKAPWSGGRLAAGCGICWGRRVGRAIICSTLLITEAWRKKPSAGSVYCRRTF